MFRLQAFLQCFPIIISGSISTIRTIILIILIILIIIIILLLLLLLIIIIIFFFFMFIIIVLIIFLTYIYIYTCILMCLLFSCLQVNSWFFILAAVPSKSLFRSSFEGHSETIVKHIDLIHSFNVFSWALSYKSRDPSHPVTS